MRITSCYCAGAQKIQSLADTEQFNRDAIKDILAVLPPEKAAIVISVLADMSKLTAQTLNAEDQLEKNT